MTALKVDTALHEARAQCQARRYQDAVQTHLWYHEHSAHEPGHGGVRLSYALQDWLELGMAYPPVLEALRRLRDDKSRALRSGTRSWALFHDVAAINQYLATGHLTAQLFEALDRTDPSFAQQCFRVALPSLADAGQFALASKYLPSPVDWLREEAAHACKTVKRALSWGHWPSSVYRALIEGLAERVTHVGQILAGSGRADEVQACESAAVRALGSAYARRFLLRFLNRS